MADPQFTGGAQTDGAQTGGGEASASDQLPQTCALPAEVDELPTDGPARVSITRAAAQVVEGLVSANGPVIFHQSGGCCDGSAPMCYPEGDFLIGDSDVHLGDLDIPGLSPTPVYISRQQFGVWAHTRLTIDVVKGRGAGFSLEAPLGVRFLTRSRLFTDEEHAALAHLVT